MSEATVRLWLTRCNARGLEGLADTAGEVGEAVAAGLAPPQGSGLPSAGRTLVRLAAHLHEGRGIAVKRGRVGEALRAEGRRWRKEEARFGARPGLRRKKGAIGALSGAPPAAADPNRIGPWWKAPRALALEGRRCASRAEVCQAVAAAAYGNAHRRPPSVWGRRQRRRPARPAGIARLPATARTCRTDQLAFHPSAPAACARRHRAARSQRLSHAGPDLRRAH